MNKYIIVTESTEVADYSDLEGRIKILTENVNAAMDNGYKPLGSIEMFNMIYCQPMILEEVYKAENALDNIMDNGVYDELQKLSARGD